MPERPGRSGELAADETNGAGGAGAVGGGSDAPLELSIIVPLYNEQDNVIPLCEAVLAAVRPLGRGFEVLLVDDGSRDETFSVAAELPARHPEIRVLRLRRNSGQTAAMAAGIEHAEGRILVTMDGDLQNDPADIPLFLEKVAEGYDIVVGWRHERKDKLVSRKIPSRIANRLIGKVTGVPIKDNGCSLKAYRADVIKQIPLYSEMHRFIPAMASLAGPRLAEIKVRHHARRHGESKYGLSRVYKVLLDLVAVKAIIDFAPRPLVGFLLPAVPVFVLGTICVLESLYDTVVRGESFSTPLAGVGVLLGALALFLLMTGMIAELVYRTSDLREQRLSMLTAERVGFGHPPASPPGCSADMGGKVATSTLTTEAKGLL